MTRTSLPLRVFLCLVAAGVVATALQAEDSHHGCSARSVEGTFGYVVTGTRVGVGPVASAGQLTFQRDGTITDGKQTVSFNGVGHDHRGRHQPDRPAHVPRQPGLHPDPVLPARERAGAKP